MGDEATKELNDLGSVARSDGHAVTEALEVPIAVADVLGTIGTTVGLELAGSAIFGIIMGSITVWTALFTWLIMGQRQSAARVRLRLEPAPAAHARAPHPPEPAWVPAAAQLVGIVTVVAGLSLPMAEYRASDVSRSKGRSTCGPKVPWPGHVMESAVLSTRKRAPSTRATASSTTGCATSERNPTSQASSPPSGWRYRERSDAEDPPLESASREKTKSGDEKTFADGVRHAGGCLGALEISYDFKKRDDDRSGVPVGFAGRFDDEM